MHFLIRYSDRLRGVDTIEEHRMVLQQRGAVWWGKFGLGVSHKVVSLVQGQLDRGIPSYAYLAEGRTIRWRARIREIEAHGGKQPLRRSEREFVPGYYRSEACSLWLKFDELKPVSHPETLGRLVRFNSPERPDLNSSRAIMYVALTTTSAPVGARTL